MASEELIILLDARTAKLDAKLKATDQKLNRLTKSTKKTDNNFKSFSKSALAAKGAMVGLIGALGIGVFTRFADQVQKAENQLKSITSSTEEFNIVQDELRRIAVDTRQSVSELTSVYARFKRAGEEAGFTIQETLDLTESLTKAMKIEGNTTAEVNSVLLQLTQSFRSGIIAGEEFRAISEGSTIVLKSLAAELGVTTGELKKMASEGLVTPEALIAGLKDTEKAINEQFADLEPTFAEVGTAMGRAFTAAYDDSIVENQSGKLKQFLIDTGADIEAFFSGKETLSESELEKRINKVAARLLELKTEFKGLEAKGLTQTTSLIDAQIATQTAELDALQERLNALQTTTAIDIDITDGAEDPRIQREKDFALAVMEIHFAQTESDQERFEREAEIHKLALDNKLMSEMEYQEAVNDSAERFAKTNLKNMEKAAKAEEKIEALKRSFAGRTAQTLLSSTLSTTDKIFSIVKDSEAVQIEAYGLTAGAKALAELGPIVGPPVAASYIGWSQVAAGVVRALPMGGGGSGGAGTPGGGSNGQIQQQRKEPDFEPETSSLEFRDATESGSATINLTVPDGDEIGQALANWLMKAQKEGRT
jgi:tape measure domain-containing protein